MKRQYTFNGTGAAIYICLGTVPDEVEIRSLEDGNTNKKSILQWARSWRAAEMCEGLAFEYTTSGVAVACLARTAGVQPYYGGDVMTATNQTTTSYGNGVYLEPDPIEDYKALDVVAAGEVIGKWTLGSASNYTGNFDKESAHGYIGEGSRIKIDGKWYTILGMTDGGEAANEVTLSQPAPSGVIQQITGMYDLVPVALGKIAKAGIKCARVTYVNLDDEVNVVKVSVDSDNA